MNTHLKIKKTTVAIVYVTIAIAVLVFFQKDKYIGKLTAVGYFLSPDELYYTAISESRLKILIGIFAGQIDDLNINVFALFSNFVVSNYGLIPLLSINLIVAFIFLRIVSKADLKPKWKFFLILNPIVPYVATSFLRDIYIYTILVLLLNAVSRKKIVSIMHFFLGMLRPASLSLILLYQVLIRSKFLFIIAYTLLIIVMVFILDLYSKDIDLLETQKRVAQVFGLDLLWKLNPRSFSELVDVFSTIYCSIFWIYLLITTPKNYISKFPIGKFLTILLFFQIYSFLYASYLGFYVGRTLFPLFIVISYVASNVKDCNK